MTTYLEIADNNIFTPSLYSIEAMGTVMSLSAENITLPDGTYYWRIKTTESGQPDAFSATTEFSTASFDGNYDVTLSEGGNNTNSQTTNTHLSVTNLKDNTTYTWNVDGLGIIQDNGRTFTTVNLPDTPASLDVMFDNGNNKFVLTWGAVTGAINYRISYKTDYNGNYTGTGLTLDEAGAQPAQSPFTATGVSIDLYNAAIDTPYWFAIEAYDGTNWSPMNEQIQNVTANTGGGGAINVAPAPENITLDIDQTTKEIHLTWEQNE